MERATPSRLRRLGHRQRPLDLQDRRQQQRMIDTGDRVRWGDSFTAELYVLHSGRMSRFPHFPPAARARSAGPTPRTCGPLRLRRQAGRLTPAPTSERLPRTMQFYLNGYKPGDPFIQDPHPSVADRPEGLPAGGRRADRRLRSGRPGAGRATGRLPGDPDRGRSTARTARSRWARPTASPAARWRCSRRSAWPIG